MIPFGDFLYFGILLYLAVPVVIVGLLEVPPRRVLLAVTLLMVTIQFGVLPPAAHDGWPAGIVRVIGFAVAQWVIAATFVRIRRLGRRRSAFWVAIALAILPLALEKFSAGASSIVAFVGLSFATFRALDVLFVVQDGRVKSMPVDEYFTYLLFFPTISAGPIDRYLRFVGDYRAPRDRAVFLSDLDEAVKRIFRGLLYGFVAAPLVEYYWMSRVATQTGAVAVVSYMYAYSLHLFFDFAGYSAFAIGTSYVLGVRTPENFDRPFMSQNVVEFWNRWHISLSTWLRDHVYGRFVLTAMTRRWFKDPYVAGYLGSVLAFGLMGLWHGPEARYLFYGFYHALLLVGYAMLHRPGRRMAIRLSPLTSRILTFHLVCFGFLIFSGRLF